jgi:hypothetical protein
MSLSSGKDIKKDVRIFPFAAVLRLKFTERSRSCPFMPKIIIFATDKHFNN